MTRKPNSGPYYVTWCDAITRKVKSQECHTWADTCALMREKLIAGCNNVTVAFC